MGQVSCITKTTAIIGRGILAVLVSLVLRVRTYESEDALKERCRNGCDQVLLIEASGIECCLDREGRGSISVLSGTLFGCMLAFLADLVE